MAPFLPKPEVVTSSRSGSTEVLNSSERKAGSPMMHWPQGPEQIKHGDVAQIITGCTCSFTLTDIHDAVAHFERELCDL